MIMMIFGLLWLVLRHIAFTNAADLLQSTHHKSGRI
jgi:hypothetical protein